MASPAEIPAFLPLGVRPPEWVVDPPCEAGEGAAAAAEEAAADAAGACQAVVDDYLHQLGPPKK